MKLPDPVPGLVIRFDYTFNSNGSQKERPCVIVVTSKETGLVTVVPITHSYPEVGEEDESLLIPEDVCKAMGLDGEANYVRLTEVNRFKWPSDRLAPLPQDSSRCDYGSVPKEFFIELQKKLADAVRANRMRRLTVND